jgi:hypothetical protein
MKNLGLEFDAAYVDRLMDVPEPAPSCMLENLHGHADLAAFFAHACQLAEANHGWAGYHFAMNIAEALHSDRVQLRQEFEAARQEYLQAAIGITSSWRNLARVHGRFATIFASGCLAIRYQVLPFTKQELLAALLLCERDHVAFVDQEVQQLRAFVLPTARVGTAATEQVIPAVAPFERLRRFINRNNKTKGFLDLGAPGPGSLRFKQRSKNGSVLGYVADGEYWIPGSIFEQVAGRARDALALKKELYRRGLLVTDRRGTGVSYVVKRPLPDGTRPFFVVIWHKPKQPPALGHSLTAAAATV